MRGASRGFAASGETCDSQAAAPFCEMEQIAVAAQASRCGIEVRLKHARIPFT